MKNIMEKGQEVAEKRKLKTLDKILHFLREEIKEPRIFYYTYLIIVLISISKNFESMAANIKFSVLSSAVYIMSIIIISYYRQRDVLNVDRTKKACLYTGITIEIWILQVLYFEYHLAFALVFVLCVLFPATILWKIYTDRRDTQRTFIVFIAYYLFIFSFLCVFFLKAFPFYLVSVLVIKHYFNKCQDIIEKADDTFFTFFFDVRRNFTRCVSLTLGLLFINTSFKSFPGGKPYYNPLFPLFAMSVTLFVSEILYGALLRKYRTVENDLAGGDINA